MSKKFFVSPLLRSRFVRRNNTTTTLSAKPSDVAMEQGVSGMQDPSQPHLESKEGGGDVEQDLLSSSSLAFHLERQSAAHAARQRVIVPDEVREVFERKILPYLPPPGCSISVGNLGHILPFWKCAKAELLPPGYGLGRILNLFPDHVHLVVSQYVHRSSCGMLTQSQNMLVSRVLKETPSSSSSNLNGSVDEDDGDGDRESLLSTTALSGYSESLIQTLREGLRSFPYGVTERRLAEKLAWREWEHGHLFVAAHCLQDELGITIEHVPPGHVVLRQKHLQGKSGDLIPFGVPRYMWTSSLAHDEESSSQGGGGGGKREQWALTEHSTDRLSLFHPLGSFEDSSGEASPATSSSFLSEAGAAEAGANEVEELRDDDRGIDSTAAELSQQLRRCFRRALHIDRRMRKKTKKSHSELK